MSRFRKKPVLIEARHWDGSPAKALEIVSWIGEHYGTAVYYGDPPALKIATTRGPVFGLPGDWIIKDVRGEFSAARPDVFAATYEPA